jgi:hypothetical protein
VNVVGHGLPVEEAIDRPRVHLDEQDVLHCEGGHDPAELDKLEAMGWNVARWRNRNLFFGGAAAGHARRRRARGGRRSAARRRGSGRRMIVRRAEPGDAQGLKDLGDAVGGEPEGWLVATNGWRNVADERRYLRAIRRYPNAAVYVADLDGDIVGRLSIARDQHPASRHVADLGLMVAHVAPPAGHRHRPAGGGRRLGAARRRAQARAARLPVEHRRHRAVREVRLRARGLPEAALPSR